MISFSVQEKLICPISGKFINKIGITSDGYIFERSKIKYHLQNNNSNPITLKPISKHVHKCIFLQKKLEDFYRENPHITNKYIKPKSHRHNIKTINNIIADKEYEKLLKYDNFEWNLFVDINAFMCEIGCETLKYIFNNMIDLESETNDKWKLIHLACRYQSIDIIKFLIEKKVNLESETIIKNRPINIACCYQSIDVIKLLIENKIDLESETNSGWRPIHYVCCYQSIDVIKLLIDNKVDLEPENNYKWRPINFACNFRSMSVVKLLIENKVDLNYDLCDSIPEIYYSPNKVIWRPTNHNSFNKQIQDKIFIFLLVRNFYKKRGRILSKFLCYTIIEIFVFDELRL